MPEHRGRTMRHAAPQGARRQACRPRILYAEDEVFVRLVVEEDLTDAGFTVVSAASADEAFVLFSADRDFDLLLTDIRMPGVMDGWDLAEAVRIERPTLPVVYGTGFSPLALRPVPGGIVLSKPFATSALIATFAELGVSATRPMLPSAALARDC